MKPLIHKNGCPTDKVHAWYFSTKIRFRGGEIPGGSDGHGSYDTVADEKGLEYLEQELSNKFSVQGLSGDNLSRRVREESGRIFSIRTEMNRRSWEAETRGDELMSSEYVIIETENGPELYHEQYQTTLRQMLDNSRRYQEETGKVGVYYEEEARALLSMQEAITSGRSRQTVAKTMHPTGVKYFSSMFVDGDARPGSRVSVTYLDVGRTFGRNLTLREADAVLTRMTNRDKAARVNSGGGYAYFESAGEGVSLEETVDAVRAARRSQRDKPVLSSGAGIYYREALPAGPFYADGEAALRMYQAGSDTVMPVNRQPVVDTVARSVSGELSWAVSHLGTLAQAEFIAWQKKRQEGPETITPVTAFFDALFVRAGQGIIRDAPAAAPDHQATSEKNRLLPDKQAPADSSDAGFMVLFDEEVIRPDGRELAGLAELAEENKDSVIPVGVLILFFDAVARIGPEQAVPDKAAENQRLADTAFDQEKAAISTLSVISILTYYLEKPENDVAAVPGAVIGAETADYLINTDRKQEPVPPGLDPVAARVLRVAQEISKDPEIKEALKNKDAVERALWVLGTAVLTIISHGNKVKKSGEVLADNKSDLPEVADKIRDENPASPGETVLKLLLSYTVLLLLSPPAVRNSVCNEKDLTEGEAEKTTVAVREILLARPYLLLSIIRYLALLRESGFTRTNQKKVRVAKKKRRGRKVQNFFPEHGLIYQFV